MSIVCVVIALGYTFFTVVLLYFWLKIPVFTFAGGIPEPSFITKISVVIAVRNEQENILVLLEDLADQSYPSCLYEVIVVDDNSSDGTVDIINKYQAQSTMSIVLIKIKLENGNKKLALAAGIAQATGSWIATTDGDCRVGASWLETIIRFQHETKAKFIFGGVSFYNEKSMFHHLQTIEFAALTGSGAASLQAGYPNMCNGANLAYEKQIFATVNGFDGNNHLASGDDEFLMHKIFAQDANGVKFLNASDAVVYTKAQDTWAKFYQQRKRWASKWPHYRLPYIKWIAAIIFLGNLNFIVWLALCLIQYSNLQAFIFCFIIKTMVDCLFINQVLNQYEKKFIWKYFLITAIIYPFYVSFFAFNSNRKGYEWKNRKWQT